MQDGTRVAAVDLGSNSFRLEIGRVDHGQYRSSEYLKETIRQGDGLDEARNLKPEAMQRGWDCLARFGERLASFQSAEVRAVATQTLREARNRDVFLTRAKELLGFPIEVISGREEARLIYQGVAHALPQGDERRLVIDIGGRSTELILGQGFEPKLMESYRVGSVAWSSRYFPERQFSRKAFQLAEVAAKAVIDEALNAYRRDAWDVAYGCAGTVGAAADVLGAAGWPTGVITRDGLDWLQDKLIDAKNAERLQLAGLKDDRRAVIGGGLSVLRAVFSLLQIDQMQLAAGGLRHGVLFELIGGSSDQIDVRSQSVERLVAKFGVDAAQGLRVGQVALHLFAQLQQRRSGSRATDASGERERRKLRWAARLHEIGNLISHSDYHKHGAYILDNSDALGFSLSELHRLGQLVLGHKGKLRKLELDFDDEAFIHQLLALRLAVILCHARREPDLEGVQLEVHARDRKTFLIRCGNRWAQRFPQSAHLLREEVLAWQKTPWTFALELI